VGIIKPKNLSSWSIIEGIDTAIWNAYAALIVGINVLKAGFAKFINLYNGKTILIQIDFVSLQFLILEVEYESDVTPGVVFIRVKMMR
jgi:hypothetical protein